MVELNPWFKLGVITEKCPLNINSVKGGWTPAFWCIVLHRDVRFCIITLSHQLYMKSLLIVKCLSYRNMFQMKRAYLNKLYILC
jgi:hypothetical protein